MAQKIEQCSFGAGEIRPGVRPARMNDRVGADELARQACGVGGDLALFRRLSGKAKKIGGGNPGGKYRGLCRGEILDGRRIRAAFAEGRLAGAVVDALAQAFEHAFACQAGERLRDGGKGKVAEILKTPEFLAAALDPLADGTGDMA